MTLDPDRPMYRWREMTPERREQALSHRRRNRLPWHSPPHYEADTSYYLITATLNAGRTGRTATPNSTWKKSAARPQNAAGAPFPCWTTAEIGTHQSCSRKHPRWSSRFSVSSLVGVHTLLEELGLDDNTLIIFTSDNGPARNRLGGSDSVFFESAGPFRGLKTSLYEGGIRVPMVARWSGKIQPGSVSHQFSIEVSEIGS